jgi:hypothetical protein
MYTGRMGAGEARRDRSERLWRLRKLHDQADAWLRNLDGGVELRFVLNGEVSHSRRCEDRAAALALAAGKRAELERGGWMAHW